MSGITGPGLGELDALIAQMGALARAPERALRRAAPKVLAVAKGQWSKGVGPDGRVWPKTKDGRIPLTDLTSKITVEVEGEVLTMRAPLLLGFHARTRPVFPPEGAALPPSWQAPIDEALRAELEKVMKP